MILHITKEHVKKAREELNHKGICNITNCCPTAQALKEQFGLKNVDVGFHTADVFGERNAFKFSPELTRQIFRFQAPKYYFTPGDYAIEDLRG